jgi:hypothetical protein
VIDNAFDDLSMDATKAGAIAVVTRALLRLGDPIAERLISGTVLGALADFQDTQFLDPSVAAVSDESPASITHGGGSVSSTGSTAAQIQTDLIAMLALITTSGTSLRWFMRPTTAAVIQLRLAGSADVPRTLLGIPIIMAPRAPQQIVLADLAECVYAADDGPVVDRSEQTTVVMDDGSSPASTTTINMWMKNMVAFRAVRSLNWARVRSGSVVSMSVSY